MKKDCILFHKEPIPIRQIIKLKSLFIHAIVLDFYYLMSTYSGHHKIPFDLREGFYGKRIYN